jgi:uncharacterized protein YbjQ (UPF0145 family)
MNEITNCPNCSAAIKSGVFNSNAIISDPLNEGIGYYLNKPAEHRCQKCFNNDIPVAKATYERHVQSLSKLIQNQLLFVPVITIHSPQGWNYKTLRMVTAQAVTGEGALTEFMSSWNDFFGTQSNRMNDKIKSGEDNCKNKLRLAAVIAGGNAVIGTDIDYAEIGSAKGMLMVCMAGTAIDIENLDAVKPDSVEALMELSENAKKLNRLHKHRNIFNTTV